MRTKIDFTIRAGFLLAMCLLMAVVAPAQNVDNNTVFELDGNPQDVDPPTGEDWTRYFPIPTGGVAVAKRFVTDAPGTSIFTQGGSKDINGISQWRHTDGSVPDKDDIQNAFAAAYQIGGQLFIYFGADRTANNGDANIGFWFLQQQVGLNANGTFSGAHSDGDIFVVAAFTSGGQTAEIDLYKWVGNDATGSLVLVSSSVAALCVSSLGGTKTACAISNTGDVPAPWSYTPKSGPAGTFPVASFFEGGINVSALIPGSTACFSTFLVETRSSTSLTAQLKDFALGAFNLCSVSMTKDCVNGRLNAAGTQILYDVRGTVTNTGVGTLYDVVVTDDFPPGVVPDTTAYNVGTLAPGQTKCWPVNPAGDANGCPAVADTFNSGIVNGPTNNASVAAAATAGGAKIVTASALPAQCPPLTLNPSMTVTKACTTDLETVGVLFAVEVTYSGQVCNTGTVQLTNVVVTNDKAGSPTFNLGTIGPQVGGTPTCIAYGPGTYYPVLGTPGPGRYQFPDQVTAVGTPSIGSCAPGVTNCTATRTATCQLCPAGSCPVPAP